jgi:hypothetical protein
MFKVNDDLSIYVTRGDHITLNLMAKTDDGNYTFRVGDIVRFKVFGKKDCDNVVIQKDTRVEAAAEVVSIVLTGEDTKFCEVISKPTDFWYEVELNPDTQPQTIIGYDEDGAKLFRLFPDGGDMNE